MVLVATPAPRQETRLHFTRSLAGVIPPAGGLSTVPRARFGRAAFAALFARALVDHQEPRWRDLRPDALYERFERQVGSEQVDRDWLAIELHGEPIGVALIGCGTVLAFAVLPAARGRGLGTRVHALALLHLAALGVSRYVAGIDGDDVRVRAVLRRNGCRIRGIERCLAA